MLSPASASRSAGGPAARAADQGLIILTYGRWGEGVLAPPPLTVSDRIVDEGLAIPARTYRPGPTGPNLPEGALRRGAWWGLCLTRARRCQVRAERCFADNGGRL